MHLSSLTPSLYLSASLICQSIVSPFPKSSSFHLSLFLLSLCHPSVCQLSPFLISLHNLFNQFHSPSSITTILTSHPSVFFQSPLVHSSFSPYSHHLSSHLFISSAENVESWFERLRQAEKELSSLITHKFDEAVKREDMASVDRFFKLFPLLNRHKEGLKKFTTYLCAKVRARGRSGCWGESSMVKGW